jgi:PAS domain S-box-containing protein
VVADSGKNETSSWRERLRWFGAPHLVLFLALIPTGAAYYIVSRLNEFNPRFQEYLPDIVLIGGLITSIAVYGIALAQARARVLAERFTQDLRRTRERDRLLERATNDAIWEWEVASGGLKWNEAVQAMFGYPAGKIAPTIEWWKENLHPDDRERVVEGRQSALSTSGEFWADEYRFRRGDGSYATVIDRGFIVHGDDKTPKQMIGSMVDITARRQAEESRRKSEQKLALHIRHTPLAVIEWDPDFKVMEWNPGAERVFGYKAQEAIGKSGLDLVVPASAREHVEQVWTALMSNTIRISRTPKGKRPRATSGGRSVNENRTKDGRTIICDWFNTPLVDATGQIIGVASLALDITASRRAEEALAAEKERLAVTLRSIGDGVITTDTEGIITLVNRAAEAMTGWTQAEAVGQPVARVFSLLRQKTYEPLQTPVVEALKTGLASEILFPTLLVARDGSEHVVSTGAAAIRDSESRIIGAALVFRDVTEQQAMAEELLRASKLESLGILAGGIAHDFNNILTAIIGNISLAKLQAETESKIHGRLLEAEKASLRAKDLTQQLLTFAKGGAPVKQTSSLVELVCDSTGFAVRGSNVRCEFSLAEDLWTADVDEGQISQVINNLALNAIQAMPNGGVVHVLAENRILASDTSLPLTPGRYVCISVMDHGVGIPADYLSKIFDPYFTTKQSGSGLGLATSYSIVKKHDGLITVESTVGVGTTFHVYLPASSSAARPALPVESGAPLRGHGRILVMDDEALIREMAVTALGFLGYEVETAVSGEEAVQSYEQARSENRPFAAVIMDLTIPGGMGGKEAIKRLHAIDPAVKGIVSSGYSNDPVMARYREHGFRGVVGKPYKVEDLAKALHEVLNDGNHPVPSTESATPPTAP